jgi:TIR domain
MKKYICILTSAALLAACEEKTETVKPFASENSTTTESPTVTAALQEPGGTFNSSTIVVLLVLFGAGLAIFLIDAQRRRIKNRRIESVPKPLIPAPTAPSETSSDSRSVFISYRRLDSADITGRIYDRLAQHFGKASIFKDVDSIPLGIDFRKHLQNSVGQCSVLLVIIGKNWLAAADKGKSRLNDAKDHLRIELETALQRDIPIIPILVQGATVPEEDSLPSSLGLLAYRNGIDVRPDPDFHGDMNRLIRGVEAHLQELR